MPTAVGPNTKGEENLVFGYDLGDISNSYKGEPTENLITDTAAFGSSFWNQKNGTITANNAIGPRGVQNAAKIVATNTDPYIYSSAIVTASTGNNTWSIWVKGVGSTVGKSAQVRINFSGTATGTADTNASLNLTEYWQLLQTTANVTSGGTIKFGLEAPNGAVAGDVMYFADPMFEQKAHATQFTTGTRSATQGLIDLTGNSTIDLTNVSFDSNAQVDYDGSSDFITVPNSSAVQLATDQSHTIEYMVYLDALPSGFYATVMKGSFSTSYGHLIVTGTNRLLVYLDADSSVEHSSTYAFEAQKWTHVVTTFEGGTSRIYIDGDLDSSQSGLSLTTNTNNLFIGSNGGVNYFLNGKIDLAKIYNRALTASEIKANYNAIKGRFNI